MRVDDEAEVRRHDVKAGGGAQATRTDMRQMRRKERVDGIDFLAGDIAIDALWRCRRREIFTGDLDAAVRSIDRGKAVEAPRAVCQFPDEDGKTIGEKSRSV